VCGVCVCVCVCVTVLPLFVLKQNIIEEKIYLLKCIYWISSKIEGRLKIPERHFSCITLQSFRLFKK